MVQTKTLSRYLKIYSGPQLSRKTKSHGKTVLSDGKTKVIHGSTQLIDSKTKLTHGRTPLTHSKTMFTHGKTKKTSWSAVVICVSNGMSCNSNTLNARKPPFLVQFFLYLKFMMFCSTCGSLVDQNANFCKGCGKGRFLNLKYSCLLLLSSDRHIRRHCYKYKYFRLRNLPLPQILRYMYYRLFKSWHFDQLTNHMHCKTL